MSTLFASIQSGSFGRCLSMVFLTCMVCSCKNNSSESPKEDLPTMSASYFADYPHDTLAFTEGFLLHQGVLFESTGSPREVPQAFSQIGIVDLITGTIDPKVILDDQYFGEGMTILNDKVFQLTYRAKKGFVYDLTTFELLDQFTIPTTEGWGLTTDGTHLIMSDGTSQLTYIDPTTYAVIHTLSVTKNGLAQEDLNELEYINGFIYANIWLSNSIVKINAEDGQIVGILDLTSYTNEAKALYSGSMEMNGIAYDSETGRILITGKMWPKIYELSVSPL